MPIPFDPLLARQVKTDSLTPYQHKTRPNFKTSTDFRIQHMLKHPYLSEFHSRAEYLHAGLLEGTPSVSSYVPQPFCVWFRNKRYTADCYVVSDDSPRKVQELKPRGVFPDEKRTALEAFFAQHGMQFEVISNESVYKQEIEAENWLEIVRILHIARDLDTTDAEQRVMEHLIRVGSGTLADIINSGDRERTYFEEIALFRLLHRGYVNANLMDRPLNYDTELMLCE